MKASSVLVAVAMAASAVSGCGPTVDLSKTLRVQTISSGWIDEGIVKGKKKLVPMIALSLKNTSDQNLKMLQVNALFRRVGDNDEWGSNFVTAAGTEGLPPGVATAVSVKSPQGYTGTESGSAMLSNSYFVDARVDLFARYGATHWTRVGQYRITRQLLAR